MTDGGAGPRPILVGVASLLLVGIGLVPLLLSALILSVGGPVAIWSIPVGLLGAAAVVFGWRIRSGRARRPALVTAVCIGITAPYMLGIGLLGLPAIAGSLIALVALVRHRAWFEAGAPADPGHEPDPTAAP